MNNLDDSENNAKVSDSAYSTSCSNSQSRLSHCSKSTHSGSNSSGSSGYGGRPDNKISEYSNNDSNQEKRIKEKEVKAVGKKKKKTLIELEQPQTGVEKENEWPLAPVLEAPIEDKDDARPCPFALAITETATHCMDICTSDTFNGKEGSNSCNTPNSSVSHDGSRRNPGNSSGPFSCVMSLKDGSVVYAPPSITTTLGYPKEMWVGRFFIDFLHPRDRTTFASQITNKKINNAPQVKAHPQDESICSVICRVRLFKGLTSGFGVKSRAVGFLPYLLKFFLKTITNENGSNVYLVVMAIPFFSAFNTPNEVVTHPTPFIIKHSAIGNIEHIDIDAVRYLGYLPQEILEKDVLQLYHPADLVQIRHIYENIVQNGFSPRSKPYRMMTQNGHYLILESEWSSLVNPWSKRLEFIIGKHYILEGPSVPNVFQAPDINNVLKLTEEEKTITNALKHSIRRVMNENLTIPAQVFKQQIDKRNQDIANCVDRFIEDKSVPDEEQIQVEEVQDLDNSCCERDSVILEAVSLHHDSDSRSSTETALSYNQLNYNENLERFFNSHEPYEEYDLDSREEIWRGKKLSNANSKILSSLDSSSVDNLSDSSGAIRISSNTEDTNDECDQIRLTKYLLQKHNAEMEKELVKLHYKKRITVKSEREKVLHDSLQNKMEHFARCNALYLPTNIELSSSDSQSHGVKRSSKPNGQGSASKHRCPSPRINRTHNSMNLSNARSVATNTAFGMHSTWQGSTGNNANAFVLGVPQPMSILSPIPMQGAIPVYFAPLSHPDAAGNGGPSVNTLHFEAFSNSNASYFHGTHNQPSTSSGFRSHTATTGAHRHVQHAIPCMMIGQAIYSSPLIYPGIEPQVYAMQHNYTLQNQNVHNIGLSSKNYEEACKVIPMKIAEIQLPELESLKENTRETFHNISGQFCDISFSSIFTMDWATVRLPQDRNSRKTRRCESEKETTRTDGESNYSSFYSSFFKTESSSTTDDSDVRNRKRNSKPFCRKKRRTGSSLRNVNTLQSNKPQPLKDNAKDQVRLSSELIYKYQIVAKNLDEVLESDRKKLQSLQQPLLVKQQLNQLYLDLQLQGVAARLTLEEGITSSSSSDEETRSNSRWNKARRYKQRHDKLVMIHEENAPLPSPDDSSSSTS